MTDSHPDTGVSLSTKLLDGLLAYRFTSVQIRIVLWVLRNTVRWKRHVTPFSWYQMAKEMGLDRAGVFRAGTRLLAARVLWLQEGCLGVQADPALWQTDILAGIDDEGRPALTGVHVDSNQRR